MEIRVGNGGWLLVQDVGPLPGPLYVRVHSRNERLQVTDLYLTAEDGAITAAVLRQLPLGAIEEFANMLGDEIRKRADLMAPDLALLASHFGSNVNPNRRDGTIRTLSWTDLALVSGRVDLPPEIPFTSAARAGQKKKASPLDADVELTVDDSQYGLTDEFLKRVAAAYQTAIRRRQSPAKALAAQAGVETRTVHSWVYKARKRGLMQPGKPGRKI